MAWLEKDTTIPSRAKTDPDILGAVENVRGRDAVLDGLIDRYGPCTLKPSPDHFSVLVETVISQQLSTLAAKAIYGRLVDLVGKPRPRPVDILGATEKGLRAIGFSRSKVEYVKNVALVFHKKRMGPRTFARMENDEVAAFLTSIKGIGEWSAQMFLIFALGRLDVFPVGDLGLRNAMARAYRLRKPPAPKRLQEIGNRWRPYRTIGTWYLWESYDGGT